MTTRERLSIAGMHLLWAMTPTGLLDDVAVWCAEAPTPAALDSVVAETGAQLTALWSRVWSAIPPPEPRA